MTYHWISDKASCKCPAVLLKLKGSLSLSTDGSVIMAALQTLPHSAL